MASYTKEQLTDYINTNIVENTTGSITATHVNTILKATTENMLPINEKLSLTSAAKQRILKSLGQADEEVHITVTGDDPDSLVNNVIITVSYDDKNYTYTWRGSEISFAVPMQYEYTVTYSNTVTGYRAPVPFTAVAERNNVRNITVVYQNTIKDYIDLSYRNENGSDEVYQETANCYIVKNLGKYQFPLVYGCGIKEGKENAGSYTQISGTYTKPFYNYLNNQITSPYIETDTGITAESAEVISVDNIDYTISNVKLVKREQCKYVCFDLDEIPMLGGNAIIAVKDGDGQIMWSWHIWAYPDEINSISYTNTNGYVYEWMNVDLGWVKNTDGSLFGTCPYYQWGRKDPVLRKNAKVTIGPSTDASIKSDIASNVAVTIQNPLKFYTNYSNGTNIDSSANYNWWYDFDNSTAVNFYNYWDASTSTTGARDNSVYKTVYDPCPRGWHVPNGNSFKGLTLSNVDDSTWGNGWSWNGRFFYAVGCRYRLSGSVGTFGSERYAWYSSSYSAACAYDMYFNSSAVYAQNTCTRAHGFVLCPVRE